MQNIITWKKIIYKEKKLPYFKKIIDFIQKERNSGVSIYPSNKDIFNAFKITSLQSVKVVILGQDPYSNPNQANGLAFSVKPNIPIPPSLKNIYTELSNDITNFNIPKHGCLYDWAVQGVMLLNTILTVEKGKTCSHSHIGWEIFTNKVIKIINKYCRGIIFLLWGMYAKKKIDLIDCKRHFILKSSHPSPISVNKGFFGCRHFSKVNEILIMQGKQPINWNISKII